MSTICKTTEGGYEYTLETYVKGHGHIENGVYRFDVEAEGVQIMRRPLNPKTGKPWQAKRVFSTFLGERAKFQGIALMAKIRRGK